MTTTPTPEQNPSQEAVEAAMKYVADDVSYNWKLCWNSNTAARILAAEVARLRALLDEPQVKQIKAMPSNPAHYQWCMACPECGGERPSNEWLKDGAYQPVCPGCGKALVCGPTKENT